MRSARFTAVRRSFRIGIIAVLALSCANLPGAPAVAMDRPPAHGTAHMPQGADALLAETLGEIRKGDLDAALAEIDRVLKSYPNFRLALLIKGDLLMSHAGPISGIGAAPNAPRDRLEDLRDEARVRLARYQLERPTDRVPRYLLQLNSLQKYALVVDAPRSTLYVFENRDGEPHYVADYYITQGKNGVDKTHQGDKKTPLGVYQVVASLPRAKLGDFYGPGAFPINYPNEWDRREGRDGHGIWLHGTPTDTYSRPPRASDGCVVLTNQDFESISKNLQIGLTPVIITNGIDWVRPEDIQGPRQDLMKSVERWRRDWESRDTDSYLSHYAPDFASGSQGLAAWSAQKRQVNAGKEWIKVRLEDVSAFMYPGRDDLAVVNFTQDYSSNNLSNAMKKRQYWVRENGAWRILYEGAG